MEIKQNVLKKKNLFKFIEKCISDAYYGYKYEYKLFFPKHKEWFEYQFNIIKTLKNDNLKELLSIIDYKKKAYVEINKVLIYRSLPFVLMINNITPSNNLKELSKRTIINTQPIYIFPNDLKNISKYKSNLILNKISNIDNLFEKYYDKLILSDCILFRGMTFNEDISNNSNFYKIMTKMKKYPSNNIKKFNLKKNEHIFENYLSTTFNIKTAINFADSIPNTNENSYLFIIKIKKEHKIPGLFIPDVFLRYELNELTNNNIYNKFFSNIDYEFELLLHRNLKIKIIDIKEVEFDNIKKLQSSSIENIYLDKNNTKKLPLKIIYAESCPFQLPQPFKLENNYEYVCTKV